MENIILSNAINCFNNFMRNINDESVPDDQKYTYVKPEAKSNTAKVEDKKPTDNSKVEKVSTEEKSKVDIKVEPKVKTENSSESEQKVTVQARKECPVRVLSKEEKAAQQQHVHQHDDHEHHHNHGEKEEQYHRLMHFVNHLREAGIEFTEPMRTPTGLYELLIKQDNGQQVLISADVDGLLYCDEIKFFLGRVLPGEEYNKAPIMLTNESVQCLKNNVQIPAKFYVPENLFILNKVLDLQTLKEKNPKKREKVFENAAKAISDPDIYSGILKAANGEPYRFAFCRYTNPNEFSIVSSKKNLSSNLTNDHLHVSKEIWINYKNDEAKLTTKKATR